MDFLLSLILIFIGIPVGIGYLLYFIPKKLGYPKLSKYLLLIFGCVLAILVLTNIFEDQLFTKKSARKLVAEQGIVLNDKFDLVHNETRMGGWAWLGPPNPDSHTFILIISDNDKKNAIETIKNSFDFKISDESIEYFSLRSFANPYVGDKFFQNYENEDFFVRESYLFRERGQIHRFIFICKKENKLIFESFDYPF